MRLRAIGTRRLQLPASSEGKNLHQMQGGFVQEYFEANPSARGAFEVFQAATLKTRIDFLRIAALLKNPSFQEEQEWRLVLPMLVQQQTPPKNPPRFRVGK